MVHRQPRDANDKYACIYLPMIINASFFHSFTRRDFKSYLNINFNYRDILRHGQSNLDQIRK